MKCEKYNQHIELNKRAEVYGKYSEEKKKKHSNGEGITIKEDHCGNYKMEK